MKDSETKKITLRNMNIERYAYMYKWKIYEYIKCVLSYAQTSYRKNK